MASIHRDRPSRSPTGPLPKSVKVRSTCNGCQQAKIRCSHEKPSCKRCQKHKIECIYSMSRRLGRPAKKMDTLSDSQALGHDRSYHHRRRVRSPKKRKVKEKLGERCVQDPGDRILLDQTIFGDSLIDDISLEDTSFPSTSFMDPDRASPFQVSDTIDLSDIWLQEFIPTQSELPSDTFGLNSTADSAFSSSLGVEGLSTSSVDTAISDMHDQPPFLGYYEANTLPTHPEPTIDCSQSLSAPLLYTENFKDTNTLAWPQPFPSIDAFPRGPAPTLTTTDQQHHLQQPKYPPSPRPTQCQYHEQTVRDLVQVNLFASRAGAGATATIDSILSCQRVLQQLAETILQCGICCKTMVNPLMVVVVSIDSLVSALDGFTTCEGGEAMLEYADRGDYRQGGGPSYGSSTSSAATSTNNRRTRGVGGPTTEKHHLLTQIDACPLLVGGFRVPSDEKFSFVQQVLHARLAGLLGTVRRIQYCTQEMLAISASQGKVMMMMETDRRLRVVMMKMKMLG